MLAIIHVKVGNQYSFLNGRTFGVNTQASVFPKIANIAVPDGHGAFNNMDFYSGEFIIVDIDKELKSAKDLSSKTGRAKDKSFYSGLKRYCKLNKIQVT